MVYRTLPSKQPEQHGYARLSVNLSRTLGLRLIIYALFFSPPILCRADEVLFTGRVVGPSNRPIPNASVNAHLIVSPKPPEGTDQWRHTWSTSTDSNGGLLLRLPQLEPDHDVSSQNGHTYQLGLDVVAAKYVDSYRRVSLKAKNGRLLPNYKLRDVVMRPALSDFLGVCISPKGLPVNNAKVSPFQQGSLGERLSYRPRVTGPDGKFTVPVLEGGELGLLIQSDQYSPIELTNLLQSGDEQEIVLPAGERAEGRVVDRNGRGLNGICVVATSVSSASGQSDISIPTVTDKAGWFSLGSLRGRYVVRTAPHVFPSVLEEPLVSPKPTRAFTMIDRVFVANEQHDAKLMLEELKDITVSGRLLDQLGRPVSGHAVAALSIKDDLIDSVITNADGGYQLSGIPEDSSAVAVAVVGARPGPKKNAVPVIAQLITSYQGRVESSGGGVARITLNKSSISGVDFQFLLPPGLPALAATDDVAKQVANPAKQNRSPSWLSATLENEWLAFGVLLLIALVIAVARIPFLRRR